MTDTPQTARPVRGKALTIVLCCVLLLTALGVAAAFALPGWLRARIQSDALQRGVQLDFQSFDLSWTALQLEQVTFASERPLRVSGSAEQVVIKLSNFEPQSIALQKATVDLTASAAELMQQLSGQAQPSSSAGELSTLDLTATELQLRWKPTQATDPLLTAAHLTLAANAHEVTLAGAFGIGQLGLGSTRLKWDRAQHIAAIDVSLSSPLPIQLSGRVDASADPIRLDLDLPETALPAAVLAMPGMAPFAKTTVSGSLQAQWPQGLSSELPGGKVYLTLKNFTPPHPVELKGFDFGKQTDIASDFVVSRDCRFLILEHTRLQAGSFTMAGQGQLGAARATVQLAGSLSCSLLAKAAAEAHLGTVLGQWAGKIARKQVEGNVNFQVNANWDFSAGLMPQVSRHIEPGCGLKPLKLQDLPSLSQLGLNLDELAAQMQDALPGSPVPPPTPRLLPDPALLPRFPR